MMRVVLENRGGKMILLSNLSLFISTFILLAGVVDDLLYKKVHNWMVLAALTLALATQFYIGGTTAVGWGLLSALVAASLCLPLVLTGMLGAGDMKLLMAFGLVTTIPIVIGVTLLSLFWGAVLGLLQSLLRGEIKSLFMNTVKVARLKKVENEDYHRIPYTIALFFGWLTQLTLVQAGFSLW